MYEPVCGRDLKMFESPTPIVSFSAKGPDLNCAGLSGIWEDRASSSCLVQALIALMHLIFI